jgi:hypothetical protein
VSARRIQRWRTKGWRMPEGAIYVGRPSLWGNPWTLGDAAIYDVPPDERPAWVLTKYRQELGHFGLVSDYAYLVSEARWNATHDAIDAAGATNLAEYVPHVLRGRDLVCWCPLDQPCHADVLLELANA